MSKIRVRFAPSPTGYVHVGNARTALFNWLFARHHRGAFVLRIEDTDVERSKEEYERQLLADLRWFGLDWDEGPDKPGPHGPYRQSERKEIYRQYATQLIDTGHAYFCFCSAEQLEAEREAALKAGQQPRYSGRCRARPREEAARKVAAGESAAIRLRISEGEFNWNDLVHGPTSFASEVIGDWILVRSDGNPAYNYAVVVDDHLMEISHVIRGDDHISNTPRQLALYQALGWEPPQFAHLSTILGPDRARLSKRHGATSLKDFQERGIVAQALRNYLLLLGWSTGDGKTEILSTEEMISQFSLDRITKSPAVFDQRKLEWLNWHYLSEPEKQSYLTKRAVGYLVSKGYLSQAEVERAQDFVNEILLIILESKGGTEASDLARLIFDYDAASVVRDESTRRVAEDPSSREILRAFIPRVLSEPELKFDRFREIMKAVEKETGKRGRELFHPIRVALTGAESGPELKKLIPLFESGAQLLLTRPVKSCAERLREFAAVAGVL
ncbi:MAG: glutamate--tRNA ligase [Terriglobia bacterium]